MQVLPAMFAVVVMFGSAAAFAEDDTPPPRPTRPMLETITDGTSRTIMMSEEEEEMPNLVTGTVDHHRAPVEPDECIVEMNGITTRCAEGTGEEVAPTEAGYVPHTFSAPTSLAISNAGRRNLRFSWHDNSNIEDSFIIERQLPMTSAWTTIATVGGPADTMGSRSHTATIEGSRQTFCYRVRATNGRDFSEPTNTACAGLN